MSPDVSPRFKVEPAPRNPRSYAVFRCDGCGVLFRRRADQKTRFATGEVMCNPCSRTKRRHATELPQRRTGRKFTCPECGKEFYRSASRIVSALPVCSPACRAEAKRNQPRPELRGKPVNAGTKNGRYSHGGRVGLNTVSRKQVRLDVADRDGNWCLLCGKPPPLLHLHRVRYGSHGGRYEFGNCVQLCNSHHRIVHAHKRLWSPELLAYLASPSEARRARLRGLLLPSAA